MNENLLKYKWKDLDVLVFDFETEDTNLQNTKPWQLAYINNKESADIKIWWDDFNISPEAARICKFDQNKWENESQDAKNTFLEFNKRLESADIVAGHNILGFDIHVYRSSCRRLGIPPANISHKLIDSFPLLKAYRMEGSFSPDDSLLAFQLRYLHFYDRKIIKRGFATLSAGCKLFDIPFDSNKLHDALYDIKINKQLLEKLIWKFPISLEHIKNV